MHFVLSEKVSYMANCTGSRELKDLVTFVNVPVLSEHITDTAPKVSTVLRDLQRTLFFRIRFAVIVRLEVSATGRPTGRKAIATLTQSTIRVGIFIQPG
jgi:hypothetical protein